MFKEIEWKKVGHDAIAQLASKAIVWISLAVLGGLVVLGEWLLTTGITLPGWLVGLLVAVFLALGWAAWPRAKSLFRSSTSPASMFEDLSETEWLILLVFLRYMNEEVSLDVLDHALSPVRFRIDQAAENLCSRGVIQRKEEGSGPTSFRLLGPGRNLLAEVAEIFEPGTAQEHVARALEIEAAGSGERNEGLSVRDLTPLQRELLQMYVTAEGGRQLPGELALGAGANKIEVEHALEDLMEKGLLFDTHSTSVGTSYGLTQDGRAFLIEHGFTE